MIVNIKDQLVQHGRVERGQLGIEIQDVKPAMVKTFKLTDGQGALISGVATNSPADRAGIKTGDVITRVNGTVVTNSSNLKSLIGNLRMGSNVNMEYMRNGSVRKCVAKVGFARFAEKDNQFSVKNGHRVKPIKRAPMKKNYFPDLWND